ncbi:MAG: DUF512 domain-containing protein [Nitrospirota bacterium]
MQRKNDNGIEIEAVEPGSIADRSGLVPGDRLVAVNGHKIRDAIDVMFCGAEPGGEFLVMRKDKRCSLAAVPADRSPGELGIVLKPFKTRACKNNCVFCFVSQLPRGMRRPLYLRDDDYRMSFLYGNYVTLTNLSAEDRERIVEQRLSPLYLSVHSTDTATRNLLLGNQQAAPIMREIKFFAGRKIRMHTQIVLCPGYNDGKHLARTIADLYRFYPYIMSIAVVPVGLTAHRKKALRPVERDDALAALDIIHKFQTRFKRKHGECVVYGADELYIKGERDFPPLADYGDLPQIENGVGMTPLFLHQLRRVKAPSSAPKQRLVTVTGVSFHPYLMKLVNRLRKGGVEIDAVPVENTFFGPRVTVTGLLTGRDVIKALSGLVHRDDVLLIPDIVMREGDEVFLDEVTREDIEHLLGAKAVVVESTPKGLVDAIAELSR